MLVEAGSEVKPGGLNLKELISLDNKIEIFLSNYDKKYSICLYGAGAGVTWYIKLMHKYNIPIRAIIDGTIEKNEQNVIQGIEVLSLKDAIEVIENIIFVISAPSHHRSIEQNVRKIQPDAIIYCFDPTLEILQKRNAEEYRKYFTQNFEKFQQLSNQLEDAHSVLVLKQILLGALSSDCDMYESISNQSQYFPQIILEHLSNDEIFVDVGAFTGDSIQEFIIATNDNYKKIIAFEPDENNIMQAKKMFRDDRIVFYQKGVSSKKGIHYFENENGCMPDEGAHVVEEQCGNATIIEVESLDDIINDKVTYIKMDIEGMELEALQGGKKVIERNKPKLAISVYHKMEDIIEISNFILGINMGYKIYLRHYWKCSGTDTILFAL